jgi:hypothetical protein
MTVDAGLANAFDADHLPPEGVYIMPKKRTETSVDAMMRPNMLFQMTVSKKHDLYFHAVEKCAALVRTKAKMVVRLYFVVPMSNFDSFAKTGVKQDPQMQLYKLKKGGNDGAGAGGGADGDDDDDANDAGGVPGVAAAAAAAAAVAAPAAGGPPAAKKKRVGRAVPDVEQWVLGLPLSLAASSKQT